MPHLLAIKRDGGVWSEAEIQWFVEHLDDLPREQVGAWLMAAQLIGLNEQETLALTDAMLNQGAKLPTRKGAVDKHSTGGVGDKMSIVLAPALHASGAIVPMLAGRGLAHTGGTIDKLEAIPGFKTGLHMEEMATNPCFIARQTADIAPADAVLYAVRDVTATVPCIGLITASILSKKAAEGIERLVLDVKVGRAAFMQNQHDARALAVSMVNVARNWDLMSRHNSPRWTDPSGACTATAMRSLNASTASRAKAPMTPWRWCTLKPQHWACPSMRRLHRVKP